MHFYVPSIVFLRLFNLYTVQSVHYSGFAKLCYSIREEGGKEKG